MQKKLQVKKDNKRQTNPNIYVGILVVQWLKRWTVES